MIVLFVHKLQYTICKINVLPCPYGHMLPQVWRDRTKIKYPLTHCGGKSIAIRTPNSTANFHSEVRSLIIFLLYC